MKVIAESTYVGAKELIHVLNAFINFAELRHGSDVKIGIVTIEPTTDARPIARLIFDESDYSIGIRS